MPDPKETARLAFEARERKRTTDITVTSEPRTYGPAHPENSFFKDHALAAIPHRPESLAAATRLARHAREVEAEAESNREARAANALREIRRDGGRELRALTTGSSSGGAFVSPEYFTEYWAEYLSPDTSFINQTTRLPTPEYSASVVIPSFTSSASVNQQTEGSAVADLDPSGAPLSGAIVPMTGEITLSQQLFDRGGMSGLAFDTICGLQLTEQLEAAIDQYVINQALSGAASVTFSGTANASVFYAHTASAREQLADTAGTRLAGTHLFSTTDFFSWFSRQMDSQGHPYVNPNYPLDPDPSDPLWKSWTGLHMPGSLRWFTDDNIPASGSNTQIIVARPRDIYTFAGEPTVFTYQQYLANQLSVVVGIKAYVGAIVRHAHAVCVITGSGYPTTLN